MKSTKTSFLNREVPSALEGLPRFAITRSRPTSPEQSNRRDIAFEVRSPGDLRKVLDRGFSSTDASSPPTPRRRGIVRE
jgi:hypothetical protein